MKFINSFDVQPKFKNCFPFSLLFNSISIVSKSEKKEDQFDGVMFFDITEG